MKFGDRLKKTIQKLEITQAALATEIGVPKAVVSQWITGRQYPLSKNLIAMYEHFNINPGYLLTGQGPMFLSKKKVLYRPKKKKPSVRSIANWSNF